MSKVTFDFTGERYVVTGASSGMGRQVTLELAAAGAEVLAIGRNRERLAEVQRHAPDFIVPAACNVCDGAALEAAIASFVAAHGKLNGGVHAAGISSITPLKAYVCELAKNIMDVSFWAGMDFLRLVTKTKYGEAGTSTVLFSSVCAKSHEKGMFAYAAAKAAMDAALSSAAKDISRKHHRVNSILPGWVESPMTEKAGELAETDSFFDKHLLGRGHADDVSGMVLFLLSDRARWMTGANLPVDGGYLA